jgi:hypothetical protein
MASTFVNVSAKEGRSFTAKEGHKIMSKDRVVRLCYGDIMAPIITLLLSRTCCVRYLKRGKYKGDESGCLPTVAGKAIKEPLDQSITLRTGVSNVSRL